MWVIRTKTGLYRAQLWSPEMHTRYLQEAEIFYEKPRKESAAVDIIPLDIQLWADTTSLTRDIPKEFFGIYEVLGEARGFLGLQQPIKGYKMDILPRNRALHLPSNESADSAVDNATKLLKLHKDRLNPECFLRGLTSLMKFGEILLK